MARMIPAFFDESTPPGEQAVFNMLSGGPSEWLALHSLDLAPWNNNRRTEIDFVVIIPDTGILCIEVKSQKSITFKNDRWHPPEIRRSPFKQAQDGSKAFYRGLKELEPRFRNFPVSHLCIFTHSDFYIGDLLSVSAWELIDSKAFRQFNDSSSFCNEIVDRLLTSIKEDPVLMQAEHPLSPNHTELIVNRCLPVQRYQPDTRAEIEHREAEMVKVLRDQQKPILTLASKNRAMVVSGAAGTGKTLVALELALSASKRGERVGLLCFNRLIGDWLVSEVEKAGISMPNLVVGRVYQVLADMCRIKIPDQPSQRYWDTTLPELLIEEITDPDFKVTVEFDYLIIDEAQDILGRPNLWNSLIQFLVGGLKSGKFVLFGDFRHQVLRRRESMETELSIVADLAKPTWYELTENCRNYEIVGATAVKLTGFGDEVYSHYLRTGGSVENYKILFYDHNDDQLIQLKKLIVDFLGKGFQPSEITVLSFCSPDKCVARNLSLVDHRLRPAGTSRRHMTYSSIQAFKGMENKVIILTDVHPDDRDFSRDLFYTGMTRCTESVCVLCAREAQATLIKWLSEVGST